MFYYFCMAGRHWFTKHLLFLTFLQISFFLFNSQIPINFSFSQMAYKFQLQLVLGPIFLGHPHKYIIKFYFLLLICLMSNLSFTPARRTQKDRGKFLSSHILNSSQNILVHLLSYNLFSMIIRIKNENML